MISHHGTPHERRRILRALTATSDDEKGARNPVPRDIDWKLVDAGVGERQRDAGFLAVVPFRGFGVAAAPLRASLRARAA
jgi:hypothetical protein